MTGSKLEGVLQRCAAVDPEPMSGVQVGAEFRRLLSQGRQLRAAGSAQDDPHSLLSTGFTPKAKISLFDTDIYLTRPRQNPDLRFFIAYLAQRQPTSRGGSPIWARVFYKDISLVWRVASHLFMEGEEMWVGKGDTRTDWRDGYQYEESAEHTTDLPFEMQTGIELLNRAKSVRQETAVLARVIRPSTRNRIRAYADFTAPREAAREAGEIINGGEKVVFFETPGDPASLTILPGFEPDWQSGLVETYGHPSRLYDGMVRRFRFLSRNRQIQHLLFLAPHHMWMIPPQAITTQLTSYGVRKVDVNFDEEAYVPGYEYHFEDDSESGGGALHSQIPEGYVGAMSAIDDSRADASAWLDEMPILQEFRRRFG